MFVNQTVVHAAFLTLAISLGLAGCSADNSEPAVSATNAEASTYNLTMDMTEFMAHVLEPMADVLWKSAGWILDENEGYFELYPTDDESWLNVHDHGAMIVEAGNLMLLPGRTQDGAWTTYAQATSEVGLRIMSAADAQNNEDLFQAGAQLYSVCTACHQAYNPEILSRFTPGGFTD